MSGTLKIASTTFATNPSNSKVEIDDAVSGKGICKAWVNFNGTVSMTVDSSYGPNAPPADYSSPNPIRASFNVDYIIDRGTGTYDVHFETAMPDTNYAVNLTSATGSAPVGSTNGRPYAPFHGTPSPTSLRIYVSGASGGVNTDPSLTNRNYISVSIFGS